MGDCLDWANAFGRIVEKAQATTAALTNFKVSRVEYVSEMQKEVREMQDFVMSIEFASLMQNADEKIDEFMKAVNDKIKINQGAWSQKSSLEINKGILKVAIDDMKEVLETELENLKKFLQQCNQLYLASTAQKEVVIDICRQTGSKCWHEQGSSHVSGVCAFNPALTLGQSGAKVVEGQLRRLGEEGHVVDICAAAWEGAAHRRRDISNH